MRLACWRTWVVLGFVVCGVIVGTVYAMINEQRQGAASAASASADEHGTRPEVSPGQVTPGQTPNGIAPLPPAREGKLKVVATVGMLGDMVKEIGGERIELTTLMGAGVDPHLYRPTRTDIAAILEADVVLYNGLFLEGKMTEPLERAAEAGKVVVAVGEKIDQAAVLHAAEEHGVEGHGGGEGETAADPHIWMDPSVWAKCVPVVRDALTTADIAGKYEYTSAAAAYERALKDLDEYSAGILKTVPEGSRVLVTAHDAFGYFARRYGYEVVGVQGLSTESEAGVRDIERIVSLLVDRKIKAVFVESTVSDRNVQALIDGAKRRGHEVVVGGELFSDAMGPAEGYTGTYLGMIDHNVTTICRALGGEAPEWGWRKNLPVKERP